MAWRGEVEDGLGWGGLVASKSEQREEARLAALERDAARYRWLRKHLVNWCPDDDTARLSWHAREVLDAEIDAAMNGANS